MNILSLYQLFRDFEKFLHVPIWALPILGAHPFPVLITLDTTLDSVIDHTISISKYNPLVGSSYIKLPKELDNLRKGLINIPNIDDNQCFKWCLVRYLNPADHHPAKITNRDKDFAKKLNFKDTKFPVKIRDVHKTEKRTPLALVPLVTKIIESMYQKNFGKKNLLIYY